MSTLRSLIIVLGFQAAIVHPMAYLDSFKKMSVSKTRIMVAFFVLYIVYDIYKDSKRMNDYFKSEQRKKAERAAWIKSNAIQQTLSINDQLITLQAQRDSMVARRLSSYNDVGYDPQWWINQTRRIRDLEKIKNKKQTYVLCNSMVKDYV